MYNEFSTCVVPADFPFKFLYVQRNSWEFISLFRIEYGNSKQLPLAFTGQSSIYRYYHFCAEKTCCNTDLPNRPGHVTCLPLSDSVAERQWIRPPLLSSVFKTKRDLLLLLMFSAGKMSTASHGVVTFSSRALVFKINSKISAKIYAFRVYFPH